MKENLIMNREELKNIGLTDEQLDKVFQLHGQTLNAEKDKHKEAVETLEGQLKEANDAIAKASESKEGLDEIQAELDDYKTKYEEAQSTLESERKTQKIKESLANNGGADLDYLVWKLGEVEDLDKLDEKITSLKEQYPNHFSSDSAQADTKDDAEVIGNKLNKGDSNKTFSMEEIAQLSESEINENWDLISQSMKNQ